MPPEHPDDTAFDDVLDPPAAVAPTARLGRPAWYVERRRTDSGMLETSIVQTAVGRLLLGGKVGVVPHSGYKLHFDRAEVEAAWRDDVAELREIYASWERHLARTADSPEAIDAILAPMGVSTFPAPESLPEPRFLPGQLVWGVGLEKTRDIFGRGTGGVFPVISATVTEVSVNRHSETPKLTYILDSAFNLNDEMIFATRQDAEDARAAIIRSRIASLEAALVSPEPVLKLNADENARQTFDELYETATDVRED